MKPSRFHIDQVVVCVGDFPDGNQALPRPQRGTIYHVVGLLYVVRFAQWGLRLREFEWAYSYGEDSFAPVEEMSNPMLAELLAETLGEEVWV